MVAFVWPNVIVAAGFADTCEIEIDRRGLGGPRHVQAHQWRGHVEGERARRVMRRDGRHDGKRRVEQGVGMHEDRVWTNVPGLCTHDEGIDWFAAKV